MADGTGKNVYPGENQASPPGMHAYLEVKNKGAKIPSIHPLHEEIVIGRDHQDSLPPERFICIPQHTISRRHARLKQRGGDYFIEDLHSSNGTYLHGQRLLPGSWHILRDGDELYLPSVNIVFHAQPLVAEEENVSTVIARSVDAKQAISRLPRSTVKPEDMRLVRKLHAMAQVGIALGAVTDRKTLTEKIMVFIFDLFPLAERAFILLRNAVDEAPVPVASRTRDGTLEDALEVKISHTIVDEVMNRKRSVLSVDTMADQFLGSQHSIISQSIRSVMCVPLLLDGECLGLIQVDSSADPFAFKEQDLEILTGVSAEAAVALKNFQLYSDIERMLDGFVRASVQAIEERDPVTAGHSFRVASYAEHLAKAVDRATQPEVRHICFTKEQLREIRYAALLHDFGKVGVREQVLRKEKKLHEAEMRMLRQRFQFARACLERESYRSLIESHAKEAWSIEKFRKEKWRAEQALQEEFLRLDGFLDTIQQANEPALCASGCSLDLQGPKDYEFFNAEGKPVSLLGEEEFLALSIAKGCLTPEERKQIEAHVVDSYSFLILIPWTKDLAGVPSIAHGHHEKLDGSGYPMGLRGEQISVPTRILTICDVFDALTAGDRPYKKAVPVEQALDLIDWECRAGHLDRSLFNVFVESQAWMAV